MIEINIAAIAILSVLLFGSVELWAFSIVCILISLSCIYYAYTGKVRIHRDKFILLSLLLILFPVIQLIPLPSLFLKVVHPGISGLLEMPSDLGPSFHSISIYPYATEIEIIRLATFLLVFSMTAYGIDGKDGIKRVMKVLSVFGFSLAIFSIIQHATWNGKIYWFRELSQGGTPFGPFVNRNHFAGLVGMIVPLSLGLAFSEQKEKKVLYIFLTVFMTLSLFFSLSRGGIISFFAGISVFSIIIINKWKSTRRLLPLFVFIVILLLYLLYLGIDPVIERFYKTDITTEQRLVVWKASLPLIRDFLVMGSGLGTFQHIFKPYKPDIPGYWDHAHNDYIELLVEAGIIGFIAVAVFVFFILRGLFKVDVKRNGIYLKTAIISSIVTMLTHSFFDFNLHIPSNAIVFSIVLGLAVAFNRIRCGSDEFD